MTTSRADVQPPRAGPVPIPGDTWESIEISQHRSRRRPSWQRLWLLLLAVAALIPTVAVPLLSRDQALRGDAGAPGVAGPVGSSRAGASPGLTGIVIMTAPPSWGTAPVGARSPGVRAPTAAVVPPSGNAGEPPGVLPLTIEAEAGPPSVQWDPLLATAEDVNGASGGSGVRIISRSGWLEFVGLAVPSTGMYLVTIVYAPGLRTNTVSVSGAGASVGFTLVAAAPGCCREVSQQVTLAAGGTMRIEWSGWDPGRRAAIDRIVIGQP